jgi:hypothetical protein
VLGGIALHLLEHEIGAAHGSTLPAGQAASFSSAAMARSQSASALRTSCSSCCVHGSDRNQPSAQRTASAWFARSERKRIGSGPAQDERNKQRMATAFLIVTSSIDL